MNSRSVSANADKPLERVGLRARARGRRHRRDRVVRPRADSAASRLYWALFGWSPRQDESQRHAHRRSSASRPRSNDGVSREIDVVLFDLGGVLIDFGGVGPMKDARRHRGRRRAVAALAHVSSGCARFERGDCSAGRVRGRRRRTTGSSPIDRRGVPRMRSETWPGEPLPGRGRARRNASVPQCRPGA